ncbi:F-box only protein 15-like isoform X2 [Xiphias gladius]|uniref:F-box only protein 15-like isoform X2 n=1 Tax=Xiphias gladius TaxID=8245 RepID=UPI001A99ACB1|nr:F-box only protein 15-like isoform X2 [Xiphias gladius]
MAAGRGEFFRSLLAGLERHPAQPAPGGRQPVRGRGKPGPGGGQADPDQRRAGGRGKQRRPKVAPSPASGSGRSCPEARTEKKKADFPKIRTPPSKENLVESVMWHKIYMSEFGSLTWKPKSVDDVAMKEGPVEVGDSSMGRWKRMFFRTVAGQEMSKWRRELRDISPYTGLPRQTEWVLRNLNVSWELTVCDCWGRERTLEPSRAYFFESSVVIRWGGGNLTSYRHISSIHLHGVRKETLKSPEVRRPDWRSLILKLDMKTQPGHFIGKDRLIKLMHLSPGVIVGIWRGQSSVAFIMVTLHFHKLVEKSLLGSPVCPYSEPVDRPPVYNLDPEFGLHNYTLHFVLHNTGTEIMSGHFRQLSCGTVPIQHGLVELKVINRTNLSQHRSLSGSVKLPWKSEALEGSVELSGCIILGVSIYLKVSKDGNLITNESLPGIDLMIAIGVIIMVLGFLGCCGAIRENRCMLLLFFITLLLIFILLLAAGILGAVSEKKVKDWMKQRLEKFLPLSQQPENVRVDLEKLQRELKCCGLVNGPSDWETVPASCNCNATVSDCKSSAIYNEPCATKIISLMEKHMEVVLGIAFAIASLLIFGMAFSMILYCQIGRKDAAAATANA